MTLHLWRGGEKIPEVRDVVTFVDDRGNEHNALVTAVFGSGPDGNPSINMVIVSSDPSKEDPFGRQMERKTSVVHQENQAAHGMYWK